MRFSFLASKIIPDVTACRVRRSPRVLATPQAGEVVLLDTARERYFTLNDVGASVWTMLAEPTTLTELVASIRREYDVPSDPAEDLVQRDVTRLLRELHSAGLVVLEPAAVAAR
jgi:hypothetical protein